MIIVAWVSVSESTGAIIEHSQAIATLQHYANEKGISNVKERLAVSCDFQIIINRELCMVSTNRQTSNMQTALEPISPAAQRKGFHPPTQTSIIEKRIITSSSLR